MKRDIEYIIDNKSAGISVLAFLKSKGYSRAALIAIKKTNNGLTIKGEWIYTNHILKEGDALKVHIEENAASENIVPVKLDINIVYEDEDLVVVDKPANMPVHPSLNNYDNTLANALAYYYKSKGESFVFRCINRLDRDTTGLVLVAKNIISAGILYKAMLDRKIKRTYRALVEDKDDKLSEGTVDKPIGRVSSSLITRCIDFANGERAVTHYKKLEHIGDASLLELTLDTGRTHQIRVHMASIGHPLVGDYLYNESCKGRGDVRPQLHSYMLEFEQPITGEKLKFVSCATCARQVGSSK